MTDNIIPILYLPIAPLAVIPNNNEMEETHKRSEFIRFGS